MTAQDSIQNAYASFQDIVTEIVSRTDETSGIDELADMLYDLSANPVVLNTATNEDLERLFWLTEFQIQNIRKYLHTYISFTSIYELTYIPGFSEDDVKLLSPFVRVGPIRQPETNYSPSGYNSSPTHQKILMRTYIKPETQQGFITPETPTSTNHFTGKPNSYYCRYGFQLNNLLLAGFTAEKDAGEDFFAGSNKLGFDFYSGYLQLKQYKCFKTLLLGDYRVNFGQGLTVCSGFNFAKSQSVMNSMQRSTGINHYQSSDENNFFRGMAATVHFNTIEVSSWISSHRVDANITQEDTLTGSAAEVSSQQTSGIHATPAEIADEDAIRANVAGTNVSLITPNLQVGVTGILYQYSASLNPDPKPYNYYYFRGKSNYNVGIDYRCKVGNVILFGEEAASQNGGAAFLNGLQTFVNSRLSFSVLHRYYAQDYQAMYGNAFGENSKNNNESGVFAGFESSPFRFIRFSAFIDIFHFPWLTYSADMPSWGRETFLKLTVKPTTDLQMTLQYRNKRKEKNDLDSSSAANKLVLETTDRIRYQLRYKASEHITLKTQLEQIYYNKEMSGNSNGYYWGSDVELGYRKIPVSFYFHYALFDTDDYNARIYAYENDLLYTFSIPALFYQGYRTSAMVKYSPSKLIAFWLKYGITQYINRETVGSGLYTVQGNHVSEVKVQCLVSF
jgi:hypothetical protein